METPFRPITREQFEAEQVEMAPEMFKQLRFCKDQERRLITDLKRPGISKEDTKHLRSALEDIRACFALVTSMIANWGLTEPPPKER